MSVKVLIEYTDGEAFYEKFDKFKDVLNFLDEAFVKREDYADKISIEF